MQSGSQFLVDVHFTAGADSMSKLKGKVAVIKGGSSGIGLATAKRFVEEGAYVFITGRRQTELDKAVKEIGKCVTAVRSDVSKLEDLDNLYRTVAAQKRKIDILFSIILNGSCVWLKGFPSYSTCSATKAALPSFARTWATEVKDRKTRTNVISPGAIDTPIIDSQVNSKEAAEKLKAEFASVTPLGRMGRPEEIALLALFLGSDESSYVAGIDLPVDGGITAV